MLLSTLNQFHAEGLTPDQMVERLALQHRWFKLTEITPQEHAYLYQRDCVLMTEPSHGSGSWSIVQSENWQFWFDLDFCCEWDDGWVRLREGWEQNNVPY